MTQAPATMDRILAATDRLVSTRGVQAVSLDDIAAEAGFTKRTLYYHFKSKDALLEAWLADRARVTAAALKDGKVGTRDPKAEILAVFDGLGHATKSAEFRGCPFIMTAAELAQPDHPATMIGIKHKQARRQWFEDRLRALGRASPARLAEDLLVVFDGALASAVLVRDGSPARAAARLARLILTA